ncbi:dimethylarginine dimethylaminohydrolase family protein [Pararhodobacter aggregans]|uniref:arginine deiminase n=1 Tax=Pararhodobacter aggregans TaxID=404875 RepID=A0A2T7UVA1_9RHOB|nr:arginine deiminase family protein [Pararhodobacter aggregans]PTX03810.1 N-dimethylarginine dimethylaminohydrolase [Pararhodobacter aggregans]PVE48705.1 amidinotransferase [Pararhodobacter aggregans]
MSFGAEDRTKPLARVMMRAPGPAMAAADPALWHYGPGFDAARASVQHAALADIVAASGAEIHWIPSGDDGLSDAVFVQDPSFVTRAGAVVLNMGKALRRDEAALHLAAYADLGVPVIGRLGGDATVESGDCLWIDPQTLAIGRGVRSNQAGIEALAAILAPHGIRVQAYDLPYWTGPEACLHLMSLISPLGPRMALIHAPLLPYALWADLTARGWTLLMAPEDEFRASNGLSLNVLMLKPQDVVMVDGFPGTRALMEGAGCRVQVFEGDALCIACEGGPTCLTRPVLRS